MPVRQPLSHRSTSRNKHERIELFISLILIIANIEMPPLLVTSMCVSCNLVIIMMITTTEMTMITNDNIDGSGSLHSDGSTNRNTITARTHTHAHTSTNAIAENVTRCISLKSQAVG